jgi:hypothetical protein
MPSHPDQSRTDGVVVARDDIPVRLIRVEALPFIFILRTGAGTRRQHFFPCFKTAIEITASAAALAVALGFPRDYPTRSLREMSHMIIPIIILMSIIPLSAQAANMIFQVLRRSPQSRPRRRYPMLRGDVEKALE